MQMPSAEQRDPDRRLFGLLASGDAAAMTAVVARHERWLRGVAFSALGRPDDVDDVLQQVWLALWRRRDELPNVANCRNWLYRLTRNAAIDAGRSARRRRMLWRGIVRRFRRQAGRADEEAARQDVLRSALQAVRELDEKYRTVLVLRVWHGLSYRRIAETLDLPVETVETRLLRARRQLRGKLARGKDE